jgi:CBS domain containing-hemolysin-like protein
VKDVLRAGDAADPDDGDDQRVEEITRDILVIPETMAVSDLLVQFREDRQQMAAIIDE